MWIKIDTRSWRKQSVRMAEWSKAPDSSSGPLTRAWVQIPLLTRLSVLGFFFIHIVLYKTSNLLSASNGNRSD